MSSQLAAEISALRSQLSRSHQEKESLFQKTREIQQQLREKILNLKQRQQKSSESRGNITAAKKSRDVANQEVQQLVQQIKSLQESRKALLAKHPSPLPATKILHHIEALELKVETEALTPEQESKMMKKLHELKKQYGSQKELLETFAQIRQLSRSIAEKRAIANQHHQQFLAAITERNSPEFLQQSKEILGLRKLHEASYQKFLEAKHLHATTLKQLKEKSAALLAARNTLAARRQQALQEKQQQLASLLKEKEKAVEEKLRTKKQLTNEDLWVFQRSK